MADANVATDLRTDWTKADIATAYPYYLLQLCPPEEMPQAAVNDLLAGRGGDAVAQLAGLSRPRRLEVDDLLPGVLRELEIEPVSQRDLYVSTIRQIIDGVVSGSIVPLKGSDMLFDLREHNPDEGLEEPVEDLLDGISGLGFIMMDPADDGYADERAWAEGAIIEEATALQRLLPIW